MRERKSLTALALALLAALGIAACGGSGSSASAGAPSAGLVTPGVTHSKSSRTTAVAYVQGTPIPKSLYEHWLAVDEAIGGGNPQQKALRFVITATWILGGARERHITVTASEVHKRLAKLEQKNFPQPGQLRSYLSASGQTLADLQARVKVELLQGRIAEAATANVTATAAREAALARLQSDFDAHWTAVTSCKSRYVVEGCMQYKGGTANG